MDDEYIKMIIEKDVLPNLGEFLDSESAVYIHVDYSTSRVKALISPVPDFDDLEEVVRVAAKSIYQKTKQLPNVVIACERIRYRESDSQEIAVGEMDSGIIISALDFSSAVGYAFMYKLPELEFVAKKEIKEGEGAPPYSMLAVATFAHEAIVQSEEDDDDEETDKTSHKHVEFHFSRN